MISISSFFAPFFTILGQGAIIHCRAIVIVLNIALLCLFHLIVNNNNVIFFFHLNDNNNNFVIPPDVSVASITPEEKQLSLDSVSPHLGKHTHTPVLGKHTHYHREANTNTKHLPVGKAQTFSCPPTNTRH